MKYALLLLTLALLSPRALAAESAGLEQTMPARPSLFFTAADVETLRAKCDGLMRSQFENIKAYADEHIADAPPALSGDNEERGLAIEHPYLTNILDFSFLSLVTGEDKYIEPAKRWTLALAAMDVWEGRVVPTDPEGDRGLYTGFGLTALACAYDWLYGDFTEEQRALIRAKIAKLAEGIHRATRGGEWWSGAYLHHDHWIPVAGMGLGALAILDEVPEARAWAATAESEFFQVMRRVGDDGAWHEGVCGWAFGMASFSPFWNAYERRFTTKLSDEPWLKNTWAFRLYSRVPSGEFLTFGDGRPNGAYQWTAWQAAPTLRLLAARFSNPHAQWLAEREWETRPNPYTAVWEIIWADPELEATSPANLPRSVLFRNQGLAILRTGWDAASTVAAFHCDSLVGKQGALHYQSGDKAINTGTDHTHADANSFLLWSRGDFAINAANYGQRDTEFQNSILVNGKGQFRSFDSRERPGRPGGEVTRFLPGAFASYVTGEAAGCYAPGLRRFTRDLYVVQPGVLFLVDTVEGDDEVDVEWLMHVRLDTDVRHIEDAMIMRLDSAGSHAGFAKPARLKLEGSKNKYNRAIHMTPLEKALSQRLVTAIAPNIAPDVEIAVESPVKDMLVVKALGSIVAGVFPAGVVTFDAGGLSGNASTAIATLEGPGLGFLATDSTELAANGIALLASPVPVTVSCWADSNGGTMTVTTREPTQIAINPRISVKNVTIGIGKAVPFITDGPRIIINTPSGTTTYDLLPGEAEGIEGN